MGRGPLHIEAEWDSASSDRFENAFDEITRKLAANPTDAERQTLEADRTHLEEIKGLFLKDVAKTVSMLDERLVAAGLTRETTAQSKDQWAQQIMEENTERPLFWV